MTTLSQAAEIYQRSAQIAFAPHQVAHPEFREFSFRLQNLIRNLGEEIELDDWQKLTRRLKRWRFEQLAAPLGFGNEATMSAADSEKLRENLRRLRMISPLFAADAQELIQRLQKLIESNDNPLLEKLIELRTGDSVLPLVILETRLIKPTEQIIEAANLDRQVEVINEFQLRGSKCYEQIVCFGASRWYNSFIFYAPRARTIHLLRFDWLRDGASPTTARFIKPLENLGESERRQTAFRKFSETTQIGGEALESTQVTPTVNLAEIAQKYANRTTESQSNESETTLARLFRIEGRRAVFLEETARVLVIDLENEKTVRKIAVSEVSNGMFVLLRDGRGGDLVTLTANKIMDKQGTNLRQFQADWKRILREYVRRYGSQRIVEQLKKLGAVHASEVNLRNWMSPNNIETRDPLDFNAIMKLCGYESALAECRTAAKRIRRAHQKAGTKIRRLLLEQVAAIDLNELEKLGEMHFQITKSGGNLIATRVVSRAEKTVEIAIRQLNRRFSL